MRTLDLETSTPLSAAESAAQPTPRRLSFVPSLYQVAAFAVLGAIFIVALAPRIDTDFWWHLKDGQYIASHHVVPSRDFMSYSFRGHSWTDHEWLAELMLFGSYSLAGLWGPIVLFAAIITATFGLVYANILARGVNRVLGLFVLVAAFFESTASWGARIQMISLCFVSLYMLLLYRFELTRDRRYLIALPVIMLFWANIHAGFVLGIAVVVLTFLGEFMNRWRRHDNAFSGADLKVLAIAAAACFAITMANPNGTKLLLYPLTFILPNAYTNLIQESASPNFHVPVMMVFEASLLLLIGAFYAGRAKLNWTHLFIVLAFTHLALSQVRNVPLWAVVVSPVLASYVQALLPVSTLRAKRMKGGMKTAVNLVLLAFALLVYVAEAVHFVNNTALAQAETSGFPKAAVAYLDNHQLPPHVFVSYGWGGYFLWHLFPRYSDYMDSRADTLFNRRILNGYLTMYAARPGWREQLWHLGVQTVLVERSAPLSQVLAEDHAWKLVFHDSQAVVYVHVRGGDT